MTDQEIMRAYCLVGVKVRLRADKANKSAVIPAGREGFIGSIVGENLNINWDTTDAKTLDEYSSVCAPSELDYFTAGRWWCPSGEQPGPDKQFPLRREVRLDADHDAKLKSLMAQRGEDASTVIRALIHLAE